MKSVRAFQPSSLIESNWHRTRAAAEIAHIFCRVVVRLIARHRTDLLRCSGEKMRKQRRSSHLENRADGTDVDVKVGDDMTLDPIGEVFAKLGRADQTVLCARRTAGQGKLAARIAHLLGVP